MTPLRCKLLLLQASALLLVLTPARAAGGGVVCTAPIPHTTQCYAGTGSLGGHKWSGVADCCAACANLTSATSTAAVPCAIWIKKRDRCLLLASDGLFDVIPSAEAVRMAQAAMPDATRACEQLTSLAARRWRKGALQET